MKLAVIASGEVYAKRIADYLPSGVTELVTGDADAIRRYVEECAAAMGLPLATFAALEDAYDPSDAVPAHHRQMIDYADELLLFWDGHDPAAEPTAVCAEKRDMNIHLVILEPEKDLL